MPEHDESAPRRRDALGALPEVALGTAVAVAIVAVAYALSRTGNSSAEKLYWVGQVALFAVPVALLVSRTVSRIEGIGIALLVPLASYAIVECYSPDQFRFLDEFAHVQTAQTILATHHLFHENTILPVSPQYPGLEITTTALVLLSRLSIYASGTVVVGVAHCLLGVGLYLLFLEVTGNPRVSASAVVIYATGPHFQFFDSYFIYEVIALPFLVAALYAATKMLRASSRGAAASWALVAVLASAVTIVSHHATSYALFGLLVCLQIAELIRSRGRRWPLLLPAVLATTVVMLYLWDFRVASGTLAYFKTYFRPVIDQVEARLGLLKTHASTGTGGGGSTKPSGSTSVALVRSGDPKVDAFFEYLGDLLLVIAGSLGFWRVVKRRQTYSTAFLLAFALGFLSLFVILPIRFLSSKGGEIVGRASAEIWVGVSVVAAVGFDYLRSLAGGADHGGRSSGRSRLTSVAIVIVICLMAAGGITGGWPAVYARLPGRYLVGAWERSIDGHNLALSKWAGGHLPVDDGVVSDWVTDDELAALGDQADVLGAGDIFLSSGFNRSAALLVRTDKISFIVVDERMSQQLPADGSYFSDDPNVYVNPIPLRFLTKFNSLQGVSRLFDDGTIQVYDVRDSEYSR